MPGLTEAAVAVLQTADPWEKARRARDAAAAWAAGGLDPGGASRPPDRPARPDRPVLLPPGQVPRRRINAGAKGRIALLHALAHIELNAIDLAWDIVARFAGEGEALPDTFRDDWAGVADDEARHFLMLSDRLRALGADYGDLPAHDGLWQAAQATAHDLLARLAVVPLVLEARGLDVTPAMIARLKAAGDEDSATILQTIHDDEIGHVAAGKRWFDWLADRRGVPREETWRSLVAAHFKGALKPPFNTASRDRAGFSESYYAPVEGD